MKKKLTRIQILEKDINVLQDGLGQKEKEIRNLLMYFQKRTEEVVILQKRLKALETIDSSLKEFIGLLKHPW
jgi:chromosome segregation ATPase